jgi:hypothetical protein
LARPLAMWSCMSSQVGNAAPGWYSRVSCVSAIWLAQNSKEVSKSKE